MSLHRVRFTGRKIGAIGGFYRLPEILVFGDNADRAVERARAQMARTYEHLHLCEVVTIKPHNTMPETPAAKRGAAS